MIYDPRIAHLEKQISYGTLGLIDALIRPDKNVADQKKLILINGATIIRNCIDPILGEATNIRQIDFDFKMLYQCLEQYVNHQTSVITYFHSNINSMIPDDSRRKETSLRLMITHFVNKMSRDEHLIPNKLVKFNKNDKLILYGLSVVKSFAYVVLGSIIQKMLTNRLPRILLITHCPFDYFLLDRYPVEIVLSHTGKIITKKDLGMKVFKDDSIPFNRTTYKLFGDKDFLKPLCRNKPKALSTLKGVKLRLKTEKEIAQLAQQQLDISDKQLNWKI